MIYAVYSWVEAVSGWAKIEINSTSLENSPPDHTYNTHAAWYWGFWILVRMVVGVGKEIER